MILTVLSPSTTILIMLYALPAGEKVEFQQHSDVHLAAVLIKLFLRELPEPLLTFESYDAITELKGQLCSRLGEYIWRSTCTHTLYLLSVLLLGRMDYHIDQRLASLQLPLIGLLRESLSPYKGDGRRGILLVSQTRDPLTSLYTNGGHSFLTLTYSPFPDLPP